MRRAELQDAKEGRKIRRVERARVIPAFARPRMIAPAVGDGAIIRGEWLHLSGPSAVITYRAMHKDDRLAAPLVDVGQLGVICLHVPDVRVN
jgi:hypothetical protein